MDTILIVEDSQVMRRTLQRLFESDSLQVQIAADGLSGLALFRQQLPCAVVLDLRLPGMSGKELCREFRTLTASVPIVVVSANDDVQEKVLLLELGADDYVTKPFSPKELLARVRRAMARNELVVNPVTQMAAKSDDHEVLTFGNARIDFTGMEASLEGNRGFAGPAVRRRKTGQGRVGGRETSVAADAVGAGCWPNCDGSC